MRIAIGISLLAILIATQLTLPWWTLVLPVFFFGYFISSKASYSFLHGFLSVFLLWLIASIILDHRSNGIMSGKVAQLFSLSGKYILFAVAGIIGGLLGGLSALLGFYTKRDRSSNSK
jgi:hypothetical protein